MSTKQVKAAKVAAPESAVADEQIPAGVDQTQTSQAAAKKIYVKVDTFNAEGRPDGNRIVDMYHPGTREWLQKHIWWAMHHGRELNLQIADDKEVAFYIIEEKKRLAERFNSVKAA